MNKNRYKLIFSKIKGCLVPVSECINSAISNGSSDKQPRLEAEASPLLSAQYALSSVSLLVKSTLNPVSSAMHLSWGGVSILCLSLVSAPTFANQDSAAESSEQDIKTKLIKVSDDDQHIKLSNNNTSGTKVHKTENNVIVIDIAAPTTDKQISDNRFDKFNIPKGAVFNNSKNQKRSQLVGYLPGNTNLKDKEANVILNQVTGVNESQIEGALEVLGKRADIVIANQNGITLNGVKTINASRFVATTSGTIDPNNMMLNVTQGQVTIGVNGFATDGLPYLDIIAKKIEQKHVIRNQDADKIETEITLVAGSSKYDLGNHKITEQGTTSSSEIAITGSATGAMHGKNIKLIVTDKGAGVKHDGMILSESDIEIALQNGDADLGNTAYFDHEKKIKAKQNVKVTNAKRTVIGNDVEAKQISINAQDLKIRANTELNAHNKATLESKNTISFEEQSKLLSPEITAKATALLDNKGRIYGKTVKLEAESLVNEKEIIAEKELTIDTQGKEISFAKDGHNVATSRKTSPKITAGFVNKGIIESKGDVTLNFKETASFTDKNTKFVKAGKHLKINAKNVELRDQDIQSGANITIDAKESVVQQGGVLASGQALSITAKNGSIYNLGGIFGAGKSLQLTAQSSNGQMGDIVNQENGLLHTLGTMSLNADNQLYNIGSIYAKNKLSVMANQLLNDVRLSGKISYNGLGVSPRYDISRNAQHGWHVNVYQLNVTLQEQHKADIKVAKMGEIRSDSDFDFQGKKKNNAKTQLINHGLINVKGTLNVNADEVINQMKGFEQEAAVILHKQANIVLRYQPRARYIWTPLAGNAERRFSSLNAFFDALFGSSTILKSSFYSAENFSTYELLRQVQNSPLFSQAMNRVFGAEWHSLSYEDMKSKWKNFKEQPANFIYYPQEKAKILAGSFTGSIKNLQNGEHTEYGSFNGNINIGKHQLSLPSVEFKPEFSDVESLKDEAIELEDILALLDTPNLFIDNSVQFEKEQENLDQEDLNNDSEKPTPPDSTENQDGSASDNANNDKEEDQDENSRDPDETQPEDFVRTDKNVDYLNPDEYFENGYLINELLKQAGQQELTLEKPLDRAYNLVKLSEKDRSEGKPQGTTNNLLKKLFKEKQKKYKEELKAKAEAQERAKAQQQEDRLVENQKEEQRQAKDKVAKQQEIRREEEQAAAVREKEKQLEIQIQAEERKQQEEKRVAQEKQQQEEKRKAEEKAAQEKLDAEQQHIYEEDVKQEEIISKRELFKAIDDTRPKVETDPLYRTKLNYINQDEYVGADYFFNNVNAQNPSQKVKVLGDNYFDHQLITRAIEKKADNRLQQKYNLTDVDLVKKLMDNSTAQAKTLHLQLGERLTKAQQAQLTEDIVWYVKTRVNNQDVFVPQVYFASETLAQNKKAQGTGLISAGEIKVKTENVTNTGTISANKLDVEASNKIRNQGSIVSTEETRLVGKKGIENLSRSFANNELGVTVQRSEIKTAGKLHLETDKDSSIDVQASDIQAKSAQIKTKELNLKNTHNTKHSYKETFKAAGLELYELEVAGLKVPFVGLSSASSSSEQSSEATSVGSKLAVGDLHLEVEKDVNQVGSELTAKQISGVVKGNYNTQAGQNLKNVQKEEYSSQIFASAHASGGGTSVRVDYNSKDGGKASVGVPTNQTGVGAEAGISFEHSKENESLLTHTNSELQVESGKLNVLGSADIGGVDINTKTTSDKGFELSANEIKSTKQKDQYSKDSERTSFKVGPEVEAHSAIADLVSHLAKEYRDAQNGIKQDETVVLQRASDMLNIITGDLAGSSAKLAVERNRETQSTVETGDTLTKIGGNVTLSAMGGSLALKNVRSDEKTNLTLKAKEDVNISAGEKTRESTETVSRQKLAHGVHAGCGLMSGTCTAGVSTSFEGNESYTHESATTHSNSLLQGSNIKIEAGRDLNLESSNIEADKVDLNVKGTTNVVSKQDTLNKTTHGFDYNVSAGVALSSATIATPTGTIGGGYTNETETARTVNQQAGIKAKTLTGQVQDLNLQGGYVVSTDKSNQLKVEGNITSQALADQHDKDGGSFGLSVGISERGTSSFNIRGGRADQKHYNATQKSTISGVDTSQAEIAGSVNTDLSKAKNVTRDDTYASTQFGFEVGDLVELGQKAKNKLSAKPDVDAPSSSSFRSRPQSGEVDVADSASVRNPIYESAETLAAPRSNSNGVELVDNPIYGATPRSRRPTDALPELPSATQPKAKASAESDYAEISNGDYSTVGDRNADTNRNRARRATDALPELPSATQPKAKASAEGIYAEISNGDYSTVGDRNADTNRSRARRATDTLPEVPNATQPKANSNVDSASVKNPIYESAETLNSPRSNASGVELVDNPIYGATPRSRRPTDALPELPNAAQPKVKAGDSAEGIYEEIPANTNNKANRALPETPNTAQPKASVRESVESDYAEIPANTNNKANRKLPDIPDSQAKALANRNNNNGNDSKEGASKSADDTYSTVAEATNSTPNVRRETQVLLTSDNAAKAPSEAKGTDYEALGARPKVRKPNATESSAKASISDPDYDTIPATSGATTAPAPAPAPVAKVENADTRKVAEKPVEKQPESVPVAKSEKTQKSLLTRFKEFFTGEKDKSAKAKKAKATQEAQAPAKPNYDGLEDNLNLKNLLALEDKRSDAFEQNVLKNDKFLDEAREAAKKSIPESTIKAMENRPEFDEILTEGAKKVETRINDAVTFKPSVEEFSQIQDLVKQLPKGTALEDINAKTQSITEALAATSKTIQGNPKLKDEVQGAISEFLKSSQDKPLTVEMIETLNKGLRPDEPEDRLLYKKETLTKENAVFSSPEASKIQLKETVDFINQAKQQNVEPSVLAGLVYQRLIAYHPFAEGNGRMARVIVNKLLLDAGYPAFTKFSSDFETQIIPQTKKTAKSATSAEVVKEFLTELGKKSLPEVSQQPETSQKVATEAQEPIYATVDKSPEARAKAKARGDEAAKNQPAKPVAVEEAAPELPKRLSDTDSDLTKANEAETATAKAISATVATLTPETFVATVTQLTPKGTLEKAETLAPQATATNAAENTAAKSTATEKTASAEKAATTEPAAQAETQANKKAKPVSEKVAQLELVEQPRTLRQQIQDKFQPLKVKAKIDAVRASVAEYGGQVSFKYAQSKGEVYNEIIKHVETQHGVCESTCAHWIANKVSAQEDFWNTLYEGGQKGKLKKEAIDSIKKLQTEFMNSGSATQQFKLTDSWLQEQGVVPKQKTVGEASRRDEVAGTVSKTDISALTKAILDTGKEKSGVKKISINLEGGSHTVSAAVQGEKVVFFDPNFGEVTFPTHEKFEAWLKNAFWEKSGYAGKKEGKRFFNVVNYELPEKTNQSKPAEKTE